MLFNTPCLLRSLTLASSVDANAKEWKVAWPLETLKSAKPERASLARWDRVSSSSVSLITLAAEALAMSANELIRELEFEHPA